MDNPACSTLECFKTDNHSTSLFVDDSEVALECHYNEAVIVDDEDNMEKDDTSPSIEEVAEDEYSAEVLHIMQSSPTENPIKLKPEDRISDGESCSSSSSTFSDHYIKVSIVFLSFSGHVSDVIKLTDLLFLQRKRSEEMEIEEAGFTAMMKNLREEIKLECSK